MKLILKVCISVSTITICTVHCISTYMPNGPVSSMYKKKKRQKFCSRRKNHFRINVLLCCILFKTVLVFHVKPLKLGKIAIYLKVLHNIFLAKNKYSAFLHFHKNTKQIQQKTNKKKILNYKMNLICS